jgi:hypothetical protein
MAGTEVEGQLEKCNRIIYFKTKIQETEDKRSPERRGPNKMSGPAGWAGKMLTISKRTGNMQKCREYPRPLNVGGE